jgi:hypothetical protein
MKIVQGDQVPFEQRGLPHREGTFNFQSLFEGEPGTPGNFFFSISETLDDFFSPRHRHNFEQYRYQMVGTSDFGKNGSMKPGMLGYFPEGVPYGPQTSKERALVAVLQFGGASGSGYLSRDEVAQANIELRQQGEFKGGIFHRKPGFPGKKNMDGFQAIWEHVSKRPMVYPKGRYPAPMLLDPAHSSWVPVDGAPGVSEKLLGVFTERRTEAGFLQIAPGARYSLPGRGIYMTLKGTGTVQDQPVRTATMIYLQAGDRAAVTAAETIEMLHLGLPNLAGLERQPEITAHAAE